MFNICKNCGDSQLTINYTEGNVVCTDCGLVQDIRIIDEGLECRNFAKESTSRGGDDPKRVGEANNDLLPDRGLGTIIAGNGKNDAYLTRWNQRNMQGGIEKTLTRGYKSIEELCNTLTLGDVIKEDSKKLFRKIDDQKSLKGRSHQAIVSACIFITCRKFNNPRAIREISRTLNVDKKDILKCYSIIKKSEPTRNTNKSASEYAKRYASDLGYTELANQHSQRIADKAIEKGIVTGKSPLSVASAAVYLVGKLSGDSRSYTEISEISTMKEITIKNCFKCIIPHFDEIMESLPPGWKRENIKDDKTQ